LFVELILSGAMALLMLVLPFHPELRPLLPRAEGGKLDLAVFGAAFLGAAYLLGAITDRLADTLLETLQRHNRLRFAVTGRELPPVGEKWPDLFPENKLRVQLSCAGGGAEEWADYLRSRIRLCRCAAVYVPGLTVAGLIATWRHVTNDKPDTARLFADWWLPVLGFCYLVLPAVTLPCFKPPPRTDPVKRDGDGERERQQHVRNYQTRRSLLSRAKFTCRDTLQQFCCAALDGLGSPGSWGPGLLLLAAGVFSVVAPGPAPRAMRLIGATGVTLSLLAFWAWWRMTGTLMSFPRDFGKYGIREQKP
jgi:hypothetical protein